MSINIDGLQIETERNRFNVIYHDLSEEEKKLVRDMKGTAAILSTLIQQKQNRDSSIAMTHLETAMMWAIKGVCEGHTSE